MPQGKHRKKIYTVLEKSLGRELTKEERAIIRTAIMDYVDDLFNGHFRKGSIGKVKDKYDEIKSLHLEDGEEKEFLI